MDYSNALFLAVIALTGLASVVIWKVKPKAVQLDDRLLGILVENSELANTDALAIIAAINRQTDTLNNLLTAVQQLSTGIQSIQRIQPNTVQPAPVSVYQADTKVIQLDGLRPIDAAMTWLKQNDPDLKLTAREAAVRASMSQATINRAQQKLRGK